jgi:hypothetical protein
VLILPTNDVNRRAHTALLGVACLWSFVFSACAQPGQTDSKSVAKKSRTLTVQASIQQGEVPVKKLTPQIQSGSDSLFGIEFVDANMGGLEVQRVLYTSHLMAVSSGGRGQFTCPLALLSSVSTFSIL